MKNRGQVWTADEVEQVRNLYKQGLKIEDISKQLDRSENAIHKKLKEFGEANRRVDWTEEDKAKLTELFNKGLSYAEIAKIMGKTVRSCQGRAVRLGLKKKECNVWLSHTRNDFWKDEEIEKIKELIEKGYSIKEIANEIGRSLRSTQNKMSELDLHTKEKTPEQESLYRRVYSVDDDYFENIDTQTKAYFLGWMITDGYVIEELHTKRGIIKSNKVGFHLKATDVFVLKQFKKELKSTFPIKWRDKRTTILRNKITNTEKLIKSDEACCFEVTSAKMISDLKKYGIHQNKTYDVVFPDALNEEFYPGFIAGMISGDGSISLKNNHNTSYILRGNVLGTEPLVRKTREILIKNIGYNADKKVFKIKNSKCLYSLELNQTETIRLYVWLKKHGVYLMQRKNEIIEKFLADNAGKFDDLLI